MFDVQSVHCSGHVEFHMRVLGAKIIKRWFPKLYNSLFGCEIGWEAYHD
jgi:hypothetical protein